MRAGASEETRYVRNIRSDSMEDHFRYFSRIRAEREACRHLSISVPHPLFEHYTQWHAAWQTRILYFKDPLPVFVLICRLIFICHDGCVQVGCQDIISEHFSAGGGKVSLSESRVRSVSELSFAMRAKYFLRSFLMPSRRA